MITELLSATFVWVLRFLIQLTSAAGGHGEPSMDHPYSTIDAGDYCDGFCAKIIIIILFIFY
jgi:hypothetical protein